MSLPFALHIQVVQRLVADTQAALLNKTPTVGDEARQARMHSLGAITSHSHIPVTSLDVLLDLVRVLSCRPLLVMFHPSTPGFNTDIKRVCGTFPDVFVHELNPVCS